MKISKTCAAAGSITALYSVNSCFWCYHIALTVVLIVEDTLNGNYIFPNNTVSFGGELHGQTAVVVDG